jgi:hypothetical protein
VSIPASQDGPSQAVRIPFEQRRELLAEEISRQLALENRRIESYGDLSAVIVNGRPVNHILHLLLSMVTIGIWLIPWAIMHNFAGESRELIRVDETGRVTIQKLKR